MYFYYFLFLFFSFLLYYYFFNGCFVYFIHHFPIQLRYIFLSLPPLPSQIMHSAITVLHLPGVFAISDNLWVQASSILLCVKLICGLLCPTPPPHTHTQTMGPTIQRGGGELVCSIKLIKWVSRLYCCSFTIHPNRSPYILPRPLFRRLFPRLRKGAQVDEKQNSLLSLELLSWTLVNSGCSQAGEV